MALCVGSWAVAGEPRGLGPLAEVVTKAAASLGGKMAWPFPTQDPSKLRWAKGST